MSDRPHQPRKRFGQNFLEDALILNQMMAAINPQPGEKMVEIGPGQGALTCPLLKRHGELTAIELDRDLAPLLIEKCHNMGKLDLVQADALKFDFSRLADGNHRIRVIGNLPYNISTPILFHLASYASVIQDMHVLLQKEVACRIDARPGTKAYGRLSVMMQYIFATRQLFDVSPDAFRPPPKVQSTFLHLTPHSKPVVEVHNPDSLALLVSAAFSQRRKTLRNSLKAHLEATQMETAGIDSSRRAETLSLQEFAKLANMLESAAT